MIKVFPVRLFTDNFSYFIFGRNIRNCMLVDPADHNVILPYLQKWPQHKVSHVLLTHRHSDHVGDLPALLHGLKKLYNTETEVVSGAHDNIQGTTIPYKDNGTLDINEIRINVFQSPCHTRGAVMYYLEDQENSSKQNDWSMNKEDHTECYRCVFTGDTHFIGGCGRFFEGTAEQMLSNMDKLAELPKDTFLFPGHEYTMSNLKWAMGIEWENEAYKKKLEWANDRVKSGSFGIPSTVEEEFDMNIFWRTRVPLVQKRVGKTDPVEVMGILREMKNKNASLK